MNKNWFYGKQNFYTSNCNVPGNMSDISTTGLVICASKSIELVEMSVNSSFLTAIGNYKDDITLVMKNFKENSKKSSTVLTILQNDKMYKNCKHEKCNHTTRGVIWICRGFSLIYQLFYLLINNPKLSFESVLKLAYDKTLKKYHNKMEQSIFLNVINGCPSRDKFFMFLGNGDSYLNTEKNMREYFLDFEMFYRKLNNMCVSHGYTI